MPLGSPALPELPEPSFLASILGRLGRQQVTPDAESSLQHPGWESYAQSPATQIPAQAGRQQVQQAGQAQHFSQHALEQLLTPDDHSSFQRSRSVQYPRQRQLRQPSDTLALESQPRLHHDKRPCPDLHIGKVMQPPVEPDAVPGQGRHVHTPPILIQHMPCPILNTSSCSDLNEGDHHEPQDIPLHCEVARPLCEKYANVPGWNFSILQDT